VCNVGGVFAVLLALKKGRHAIRVVVRMKEEDMRTFTLFILR